MRPNEVLKVKTEFDHLVFNLSINKNSTDMPILRVDRTTPYGNPYKLLVDTPQNRVLCIIRYHSWLQKQVREGEISMEKLAEEIAGVRLGCWCAPKLCHAHILSWAAYSCKVRLEKKDGNHG